MPVRRAVLSDRLRGRRGLWQGDRVKFREVPRRDDNERREVTWVDGLALVAFLVVFGVLLGAGFLGG